ncbi:hypothetical protein SDC9_187589 [bioreactor metagenome]|uniref:Uncharacterized protein n=1 Tax=bioreactor metagenome TaxID=1076179 RepID=A0A645HV63_9ZZZZ
MLITVTEQSYLAKNAENKLNERRSSMPKAFVLKVYFLKTDSLSGNGKADKHSITFHKTN